jgi:hypothetical protein
MNIRIGWLLAMVLGAAQASADPRLKLPEFAGLAAKASKSVVITLDGSLLGMAAKFLNGDNPDEAAAKELIGGIQGIYVLSYTFDQPLEYAKSDVDAVRKQLSAPGWNRIAEVRSRKEHTDVDIYISVQGDRPNGLALIASEPNEFTIVNIVGSVDLDKLRKLEGKLGVPKLELDNVQKK